MTRFLKLVDHNAYLPFIHSNNCSQRFECLVMNGTLRPKYKVKGRTFSDSWLPLRSDLFTFIRHMKFSLHRNEVFNSASIRWMSMSIS